MKLIRKSPKRWLLPYIVVIGIPLLVGIIGFVLGRCSVKSVALSDVSASNDVAQTIYISQIIPSSSEPTEEWIEFTATAYCPCEKCCGKWGVNRPTDETGQAIVYTASGARAVEGVTIASDWSVLPKGTQIEIENMGTYIVQDKGGCIVGNKIDIYFNNHQDAKNFGVQIVKVKLK